ncbi:MAG: hypothetical protein CVU73_01880 [Deltaproteobacteria bacterium HGW-Deltaproteobacteria-8]|jgi:Ca2+-binding EF-hand superfamily protein|nr:MAG: hypothetical protein CVU73_01880 [Deltaproteobacteria bacterium HGW-Deltaproteobacteria-8]
MEISSSLSSISGYSAVSSAYGSQNTDDMDSKLADEILKAKDTDGSGTLTASELGVSQSNVAEYDTDGDGVVSAAELAAGLKAKREQMQAQMQNQMSQDGQMGMLQAAMGQGMDLSALDTKMSKSIISEKDTNKDGVLSAEELGASADDLSAVDTDGDGSVNESELTASLKAHREEMMAENGGSMPAPPTSDSVQSQSGAQSTTNLDNLISGLFSNTSSTTGTTSSSDSDSSSLTGRLADYMLRQKASSSYQNIDTLISSLFANSEQSAQSVSVSV